MFLAENLELMIEISERVRQPFREPPGVHEDECRAIRKNQFCYPVYFLPQLRRKLRNAWKGSSYQAR